MSKFHTTKAIVHIEALHFLKHFQKSLKKIFPFTSKIFAPWNPTILISSEVAWYEKCEKQRLTYTKQYKLEVSHGMAQIF